MNKKTLEKVLTKYKSWLKNALGGKKADLCNDDLRNADLQGVDLRTPDSQDVDFYDPSLLVLKLPFYTAHVQKEQTRIGCKQYKNEKWRNFSDKEIANMDGNALEFWNAYKAVIFAAMDSLQAESE